MITGYLYFYAKSEHVITSSSRLYTSIGVPGDYFVEYSDNPEFGADPIVWVLATRPLVARIARGIMKDMETLASPLSITEQGKQEPRGDISDRIITFYHIRDLWVSLGRQFNDMDRRIRFPSQWEIELVKDWIE